MSQVSGLLALTAPPAAAAVMIPFRAHITNTALALIMVAVVMAVVTPGRRWAALAAGVSAGVWFDFFLTRPFESFTISRSADLQTTILLLVVSIGVGELAARDRRHRNLGASSSEGLAAVHSVSALLASGAGAQEVLDGACEALTTLLYLSSCTFDPSRAPVTIPYIERPGFVSYSVYKWDTANEGLPVSRVMLPIHSDGLPIGRFVLKGPSPSVPIENQRLAGAIVVADIVGVALERQALARQLTSLKGHNWN